MKFLEGSPTTVAQLSARLYALWEADQRAARGLLPGDSLDVETTYDTGRGISRVLPLAEARTNGLNGYVLPVVSQDAAIAALPLDDFALAQQGRGGVDVRGHKDEAALDARIRAKIVSATP